MRQWITSFNMTSIKKVFDEAVDRITANDWQNAIKHVLDVESSCWKNDNICDIEIEQVLINTGEDTMTESDSSDHNDACQE